MKKRKLSKKHSFSPRRRVSIFFRGMRDLLAIVGLIATVVFLSRLF